MAQKNEHRCPFPRPPPTWPPAALIPPPFPRSALRPPSALLRPPGAKLPVPACLWIDIGLLNQLCVPQPVSSALSFPQKS